MNNTTLQRQVERQYYFTEAMAFYEAYYSPVLERVTSSAPRSLRAALETEPRREDRPLTWVPIVWHATSLENFQSIVADGYIRAPVHLTELPIGEIDRIRLRKHSADQVAIGFPRRFLETKKITPVLYTKYNPELASVIESNSIVREALKPFLAEADDDTSSFLELRTTETIEIDKAVWLLTTRRVDNEGIERPWVPGLEEFQAKWGRISISYWHRSHQLGVLNEWHFLQTRRNQANTLIEAMSIGELYWEKHCRREEAYKVTMPAGKSWELKFQTTDSERAAEYDGPLRFIDLAKRFKRLHRELQGLDAALPYAMIPDLLAE